MDKKALLYELFQHLHERYVAVDDPELFVGLRDDVIDIVCVDGSNYVILLVQDVTMEWLDRG